MRSKKQGLNSGKSGSGPKFSVGLGPSFRIKFDTSITNISCFIGHRKSPPRLNIKKSLHFTPPKARVPEGRTTTPSPLRQRPPSRDPSPDIVRELSNSILSTIEQEGVNCTWHEQEDGLDLEEANDLTIWSAFDSGSTYEKSFASTSDLHPYQGLEKSVRVAEEAGPTWAAMGSRNLPLDCVNTFEIREEQIERGWRTTLMIRNVPNKYSIGDLAAQIDAVLPNTYDFLYLPCDFKNQCNMGYGFINFIDTKFLELFYSSFHNYHWKKYRSEKICALTYARLQGLKQLLEHFMNSKVLNQKDKRYRPIIKYEHIHKIVLEQQGR